MNEILSQSIFFGIAITLVTYEIGLWIKQKTGKAIATKPHLGMVFFLFSDYLNPQLVRMGD